MARVEGNSGGERRYVRRGHKCILFVDRLISLVETLAMLEEARKELEEMRDTLVVVGNEEKSKWSSKFFHITC